MATNTFKKKLEHSRPGKKSRFNPFTILERKLAMSGLFGEGIPVRLVPPFLYAAFLALVYIWSNHKTESTIRKINLLQVEVEDLRADVTTLEAEYMYASKQSEVAKRIGPFGIEEIDEPPFKIIYKK